MGKANEKEIENLEEIVGRNSMKGGHKVKFNAWKRWIDTRDVPTNRRPENYHDERTTIRYEGYEGDCSSNAFLLLGLMNRETAIHLADRTGGYGLMWVHATDLLDAAFPGYDHVWRQANSIEQIKSVLADGEATIGGYNGYDFGHYFVVFNEGGKIYVADSYFHVTMPYEQYKKWYGTSGEIFIVDSNETAPSSEQRITIDIVNSVVNWDEDTKYPTLEDLSEKQLSQARTPAAAYTPARATAYAPSAAYTPSDDLLSTMTQYSPAYAIGMFIVHRDGHQGQITEISNERAQIIVRWPNGHHEIINMVDAKPIPAPISPTIGSFIVHRDGRQGQITDISNERGLIMVIWPNGLTEIVAMADARPIEPASFQQEVERKKQKIRELGIQVGTPVKKISPNNREQEVTIARVTKMNEDGSFLVTWAYDSGITTIAETTDTVTTIGERGGTRRRKRRNVRKTKHSNHL